MTKNKTCNLKNDCEKVEVAVKISLSSVIEYCNKIAISDVVSEAILNAIQSDATNILVKFTTQKEGLFENIKSIEIIDNGEGFNNKNQDAFQEIYTPNKKDKGCKGFGRIYYKKAFKEVEISSFNSDENNEIVNFCFTKEDFLKKNNIVLYNHTHEQGKETSLLLLEVNKENIIGDTIYNIENLHKDIFNVVYPYIFLQHNKNIQISFYHNEEQEKYKNEDGKECNYVICLDNIENIECETIDIKDGTIENKLSLWYKITKKDKPVVTTAICYKNRPCFESSFDKQPLQINVNVDNFDILFLLEGKWINNQKLDKYHKIIIDDKNKDKWNNVKNKVEDAIVDILSNKIPNIKQKNQQLRQDFINKFPEYTDIIKNEKDIGYFNYDKMLEKARKYRNDLEDKVVNNKGNKKQQQKNIDKIMGMHLLSYIRDRQKVIDNLKQLLTDKPKLEKALHNLIIRKGLDGAKESQLSLTENHIWLLDDKFMTYSYVASDKTICDILDGANIQYSADELAKQISKDDRPDIAVYKNDIGGKKIVFVELKKIKAKKYDYAKGLDQLNNYASYFAEQGIREIYCYLFVANFDEVRRILSNRRCVKVFSHDDGEIWQNTLTTSDKDGNDLKIPAYLQVISIDAIVNDADKRNNILLRASREYVNNQN